MRFFPLFFGIILFSLNLKAVCETSEAAVWSQIDAQWAAWHTWLNNNVPPTTEGSIIKTHDEVYDIDSTNFPTSVFVRMDVDVYECRGASCGTTSYCSEETHIVSDKTSNEDDIPEDNPVCTDGSIIDIGKQTLGESIDLVGTGLTLNYSSERDFNRKVAGAVSIPMNPDWIDSGTTKLYLDVTYDEETHTVEFNNDSGQKIVYQYRWDGKSRAGVKEHQSKEFEFRIREYPAQNTPEWRGYRRIWLGNYDAEVVGLGGWTINVHHFFDIGKKKLYKGNGETQTNEYIELGSGEFAVIDNNGSYIYIFHANGKHKETRTTLLDSLVYSFSYDGNGFLSSIEDAYSNETTINRDGSGNLTGITSEYSQTTSLSLNSHNRLVTVTNPNSETYNMTYHMGGRGLLKSFQKPEGQISEFSYDDIGRLTLDERIGGKSTALNLTGDNRNRTLTVTTKEGRETIYDLFRVNYDSDFYFTQRSGEDLSGVQTSSQQTTEGTVSVRGDITTSIEKEGDPRFGIGLPVPKVIEYTDGTVSNTYTYTRTSDNSPGDFFGYTTLSNTQVGPFGTSTSVFNKSTKTWTNTSPESRVSTIKLDSNERVVEEDSSFALPIEYSYNGSGKLSGVTQGTRDTTYSYNADGFLYQITNELSQVTELEYDDAGRVITTILPDLREIAYTYDDNGKLTSITPPGKSAHQFSYGASTEFLDSLVPPTLAGVTDPKTYYYYDDDGLLTKIIRPDGAELDYSYVSGTHKLASVSDGTDSFSYTSYDGNGFSNEITSSDDLKNTFTRTGPYLESDILTNLDIPQVHGAVVFDYSNFRIAGIDIKNYLGSTVSSINYTFDDDSILDAVGVLDYNLNGTTGLIDTVTIGSLSEDYDFNTYGEIEAYDVEYSSTSQYSYSLTRDGLGRISSMTESVLGTSTTYDYTYDSSGRLDDVEINSVVQGENTYDTNSNRTSGKVGGVSFTASYDEHDRLTDWKDLDFTYNDNGEMTSMTDTISSDITTYTWDAWGRLKTVTLPNSDVVTYKYDGRGRKAEVLLNSSLQAAILYQDQLKPVAIIDGSGNLVARFVWGSKGNVPEYMVKSGVTYRFITDPRGSVRLVMNVSNGTVSQRIDYDEWGRVTNDTNPGFQPFGFAGGLYDTQTGLVQFGARHYNGDIGRWLSKDPIDFRGGDTNLYGYVLQDPVNFIDPSGKYGLGSNPFVCIVEEFGRNLDRIVQAQQERQLLRNRLSELNSFLGDKRQCNEGSESIRNTINNIQGEIDRLDNIINTNAAVPTIGSCLGFGPAIPLPDGI